MRRLSLAIVVLAAGFVASVLLDRAIGPKPAADAQTTVFKPIDPGPTLAQLASGQLSIVDLCWPINRQAAYWPGDNYRPFELHTIATLEKDGVLSKAFTSPEHLGTHIDAPNHFERERISVDQIPPADLFAPGVVLDVSAAASVNADYQVAVADIERYEAEHGTIPTGAVVLARTGWGRFWQNPDRYQGRDVMGRLHFPGFSPEAVTFLLEQRKARGVGIDTLSVDPGTSRDFPVHHLLGKASRYGLENLSQLEKLPAGGFYLVVAPMKIETGSGGPTRVFAVAAKSGDGS